MRTNASGASRRRRELNALAAARALVERMSELYRDLERRTGAPIAAHRAIACLSLRPGLRASQLADELGMRRPALSQLLRTMAGRGWVRRSRNLADQRAVTVALTRSGLRLQRATAGRAVGALQRAVRALSGRQLAALAESLPLLVRRLPAPPRHGGNRMRR